MLNRAQVAWFRQTRSFENALAEDNPIISTPPFVVYLGMPPTVCPTKLYRGIVPTQDLQERRRKRYTVPVISTPSSVIYGTTPATACPTKLYWGILPTQDLQERRRKRYQLAQRCVWHG